MLLRLLARANATYYSPKFGTPQICGNVNNHRMVESIIEDWINHKKLSGSLSDFIFFDQSIPADLIDVSSDEKSMKEEEPLFIKACRLGHIHIIQSVTKSFII